MPSTNDIVREMAARRAAAHRAAERDRVRDLVGTALQCFGWSGLGIFLILWSAHTTNMTYGIIAFWSGFGIGNGGVIFSLLGAYRRGEQRGDW